MAQQTPQQLLTKLVPKESNSRAKILAKDKNTGRLFVKFFLWDSSMNDNFWGITSDESIIRKNLEESYRGKPILLYKNSGHEIDRITKNYQRVAGRLDHPPWDDASMEHSLKFQEIFRVGTHLDYVKHGNTWWGIGEITDDNLKKYFNENPSAPFFVSPSVRQKHLNQDPRKMKDWWFMHTAIVSVPAWGFQKAFVKNHCNGDDSCVLKLRTASQQPPTSGVESKPSCGFCTYEAMKEATKHAKEGVEPLENPTNTHAYKIQASTLSSSSESSLRLPNLDSSDSSITIKDDDNNNKKESGTTNQTNQTVSSHLQKSPNFQTRQSLSDNSTNTINQGETASVNSEFTIADSNANPQTIHVETQTIPQGTQTTATPQPAPLVGQKVPEQVIKTRPAQKFVSATEIANNSATSTPSNEAQSNNNSNSIEAQKNKLIELLAENEKQRNQLVASQKAVASLQTERDSIVQLHASDSSRIKQLEEWKKQKEDEENFTKIADTVFGASIYDTLSEEDRIAEAKTWFNSGLPVEQVKERIGSLETRHKQALEGLQKKFEESSNSNNNNSQAAKQQQQGPQPRVALAGMTAGNVSRVVSATKTASLQPQLAEEQQQAVVGGVRSTQKPITFAIDDMLFGDLGGMT